VFRVLIELESSSMPPQELIHTRPQKQAYFFKIFSNVGIDDEGVKGRDMLTLREFCALSQ
jgi:hypothetical protein